MEVTEVVVEQEIAAKPEVVFDLWIDPEKPGSPWHDAKELIVNPAVGSLFYFAVGQEGRTWPHYGRFLRIERPKEIAYTWVSEATKGLESVVDITFEASPKGTKVILRHSGVPDDPIGRQHKEGWSWVLSIVAERLEGA